MPVVNPKKYPGAIILAKPFRPDQLTSAMGALLARMQEARSFVDPTSGFAARS